MIELCGSGLARSPDYATVVANPGYACSVVVIASLLFRLKPRTDQ
jgi:hypothetical protein